jgi:hypothetical protein
MTFSRSVNRIQRIAHSKTLDHLFDELISDCAKRISLLRPFGRHGQAEQELKSWNERRSLINSFRSDDLLPTALRKQIADHELLRIKTKESQFGRVNQSHMVAGLKALFNKAEMIRNRVADHSVAMKSESLGATS